MTFSVVCYDPTEEKWGVGVASRFLSVGSVVPWAKAGVGCIATQSYANYSYGPDGLKLLQENSSRKTIEALIAADPMREKRQVAAVDAKGVPYAFTGRECLNYAGHILGENFSVQGNILAGPAVLEAMAREMEGKGKLEDRILAALFAAERNGGDRRGKQSASILITSAKEVFEEGSDIYMDIRVEDSQDPLPELKRIMTLWMATFLDVKSVPISNYSSEINKALRESGYDDLVSWASANNFEHNLKDGKIGEFTLKILLKKQP